MSATTSSERDIAIGVLTDKEFLAKASESSLIGKDFDRKVFGWIYDSVTNYWKNPKYGKKLPTKKVLKKLLEKDRKLDEDTARKYLRTIKVLYRKASDSPAFSLQQIEDFKRSRNFVKQLEKSAELLSDRETEEAISSMHDFIMLDDVSRSDDVLVEDWLDFFEDRQKRRKERKEHPEIYRPLRFGIRELDNMIPRGVMPGSIGAIAAQTGIGKSIFCNHVVFHSLLDGLGTTYVVNENDMDQVNGRLDSLATGVPYNDLQMWRFDGEKKHYLRQSERMIEALRDTVHTKVKTIKLIPHKHTIMDVRREIDRLRRLEGHDTQSLIIDSPDLMAPVAKYKEYRLQRAAVFWEIWTYLREQDIRGFVSTQLKAEIEGIPSPEDVAEAYDKARLLDCLLVLIRSKKQRLLDEASIAIAKSRDSAHSGEVVPLRTDMTRMALDMAA